MDVHENARTASHGRMLLIERLQAGWSVADVAKALDLSPKTVRNTNALLIPTRGACPTRSAYDSWIAD